jgi:hypothetical protein
MDNLGTGTLVMSNQAISFLGEQSCRTLLKHIIAFQWYRDGFGFETDAANNNHYIFSGLDGADVDFLAGVTTGLSDLDTSRGLKDRVDKILTTGEDRYRQVVAFSEQRKITPQEATAQLLGSNDNLARLKDGLSDMAVVYCRDPQRALKILDLMNRFGWSLSAEQRATWDNLGGGPLPAPIRPPLPDLAKVAPETN